MNRSGCKEKVKVGDVTVVRRNQFIGQNVCDFDVAICVNREENFEKKREKELYCRT